jgi:hypothetical protein
VHLKQKEPWPLAASWVLHLLYFKGYISRVHFTVYYSTTSVYILSIMLYMCMILEHPLDSTFSSVTKHFIMTNFDSGNFSFMIPRMKFHIYFSKAYASGGLFQ